MLNYFRHRATSGYVKALDGVPKYVQRMGRGYRFDVVGAKVIYGPEHPTERSKRTATTAERDIRPDRVPGVITCPESWAVRWARAWPARAPRGWV